MLRSFGAFTQEQDALVERFKDVMHLIDQKFRDGTLSEADLKRVGLNAENGVIQNFSGFVFNKIHSLDEVIETLRLTKDELSAIQSQSRDKSDVPQHMTPIFLIIKAVAGPKLAEANLIMQQVARAFETAERLATGQLDTELNAKHNMFQHMNERDAPALKQAQMIHRALNSYERIMIDAGMCEPKIIDQATIDILVVAAMEAANVIRHVADAHKAGNLALSLTLQQLARTAESFGREYGHLFKKHGLSAQRARSVVEFGPKHAQ